MQDAIIPSSHCEQTTLSSLWQTGSPLSVWTYGVADIVLPVSLGVRSFDFQILTLYFVFHAGWTFRLCNHSCVFVLLVSSCCLDFSSRLYNPSWLNCVFHFVRYPPFCSDIHPLYIISLCWPPIVTSNFYHLFAVKTSRYGHTRCVFLFVLVSPFSHIIFKFLFWDVHNGRYLTPTTCSSWFFPLPGYFLDVWIFEFQIVSPNFKMCR